MKVFFLKCYVGSVPVSLLQTACCRSTCLPLAFPMRCAASTIPFFRFLFFTHFTIPFIFNFYLFLVSLGYSYMSNRPVARLPPLSSPPLIRRYSHCPSAQGDAIELLLVSTVCYSALPVLPAYTMYADPNAPFSPSPSLPTNPSQSFSLWYSLVHSRVL